MLDADAEQFAAALTRVEQDLDARIDELTSRREMLRRLEHGDRLLLPERACDLLQRLPELGCTTERMSRWRAAG